MMFLMFYDLDDWLDEVNDLINVLICVRCCGVEVYIFLENSLDINREVYNYFKFNGIDVLYDFLLMIFYVKIVVVDGRIVFFGSYNWSEFVFYWNYEVSVKIIFK